MVDRACWELYVANITKIADQEQKPATCGTGLVP